MNAFAIYYQTLKQIKNQCKMIKIYRSLKILKEESKLRAYSNMFVILKKMH
jgi:hypothetical protein